MVELVGGVGWWSWLVELVGVVVVDWLVGGGGGWWEKENNE